MRPEAPISFPPSRLPVQCPPAKKGEPLKQEAPGPLHTLRVGAPVLQSVVCEVPQDVQALRGRDVPVSLFFDLREQPGLKQGTTAEEVLSEGRGPPSSSHLSSQAAPSQEPQVQQVLAQLSPPSCRSPGNHDPRNACLHGTVGVLKRKDVPIS